jgi:predicted nucleic-acid-binding protein
MEKRAQGKTDPPTKTYLIDTNVILRYLLDDHPEFSPKALQLMQQISTSRKKAEILDVVLLECIYVMDKFYNIPSTEIVDRLSRLLNFSGIVNSNKAVQIKALMTYQEKNIDFVDCLLSAYSGTEKPVVSFDRDFRKLAGHWEKL